jgi:glycosyltransferase involved in cell wall biosynthesis
MRIGIDARFYGPIGKGLGRYTQKMIENLEKISSKDEADLGSENEYFILLRSENFEEYQSARENFHKVLANYGWYSISEQIQMPRLLNKLKLDLVHFPHFNVPLLYRKKFVVTIHDLILLHFPTLRGTLLNPVVFYLKYLAHRLVIYSTIKRATRVIAVSNFTRSDIIKHYPFAESKIDVTYEACENYCWLADTDKIINKYGIIKPYLLYVGNAYPHKNLENLIKAFQLVKQSIGRLQLVIVGKEDYFYRKIKNFVESVSEGDIVFAGFVPDQELDALYREASLFIFPSLYEGFGLPPLEAMAKGAPVVSSDHPCMKEILGESAIFANAGDKKKFAEMIIEGINNKELRHKLIEKGYQQVQKYSWEKLARETLAIYQKAANSNYVQS